MKNLIAIVIIFISYSVHSQEIRWTLKGCKEMKLPLEPLTIYEQPNELFPESSTTTVVTKTIAQPTDYKVQWSTIHCCTEGIWNDPVYFDIPSGTTFNVSLKSVKKKEFFNLQSNSNWFRACVIGLEDESSQNKSLPLSEQTDATTQYDLGLKYLEGRGVTKDDAEAVRLFRRAADLGLANGQNHLGWMYFNGRGVTKDQAEAVRWFRKAAEQGNQDAQFNLGYMYQEALGIARDDAEAARWFLKAAEQGNPAAQVNIGARYYAGGLGVPFDEAEAVKWFRKAAEQGDATGQYELGQSYQYGKGVKQDYAEAIKWYHKSAEQGNLEGQFKLGGMYHTGRGVKQDYTEAIRLYRKAADSGLAVAQCQLGIMYEEGRGVTTDKAEAVRWYRKAAEQGLAIAKIKLTEVEPTAYQTGRVYETNSPSNTAPVSYQTPACLKTSVKRYGEAQGRCEGNCTVSVTNTCDQTAYIDISIGHYSKSEGGYVWDTGSLCLSKGQTKSYYSCESNGTYQVVVRKWGDCN